eukprot:s2946_g7.t1
MAPLPPRPSWVTVTDPPEPPCGYGSPLAPWRPAGRKSLKQSQVFLNQVPAVPSRPSSAPSTTAASARPSSGRSWGSWSRPPSAPAEAAERPQSAPVRPRSAPRRLQPPSRPSSAWQRPSSAPAGPRGTNATNGALSVSWRGRRYRVRQTGLDRSQLSQTSLDSMANAMASFSIYTDHGLSDDEDHLPPAEKTEDAPPPEADAASTEMAVEAESEDSGTSTVTSADPGGSAAEAAKMWSGKATLGILQVSVAERPLYAELKMGGEAQCTSCVTGRWPSLAEKLTFELQDIRVQETLTLCFWTSGQTLLRPLLSPSRPLGTRPSPRPADCAGVGLPAGARGVTLLQRTTLAGNSPQFALSVTRRNWSVAVAPTMPSRGRRDTTPTRPSSRRRRRRRSSSRPRATGRSSPRPSEPPAPDERAPLPRLPRAPIPPPPRPGTRLDPEISELLESRPAGLAAFLEDLGVRTMTDIRFMWGSGHELVSEFERLAGRLPADMAFAVSSLWTLSMSRATTALTSQVTRIVQERESTTLVRPPADNEPGEPPRVVSYRRLIDAGGTPHTPTMVEAAAACPHAREQATRMAKLDSFFQLLLEDVLDLNAMGTTIQQLQDPGSLQSLKEMVMAKPSQLSTERVGALMAAYRRWKRFAVAKRYPVRSPSALQLAEFFQVVSKGGPTAASSAWQSLQWFTANMGVEFPMQHWLVTPYRFVPATHNATQALELEPWELVNLMLFAKRQCGTNLILACFVLQTALSCIRFEHVQRSRPLSETRHAALYRCAQGKRRIRGARPGYVWATSALEFQGFSLLKVLVEFYKHECLSDVPFLWPQVQLEAADLWEIHQATPFLVSKKMSRSRFLEIFRGMLHQAGTPHELASTAGFNRLRRFLPTLGNVLRLEPPEMQAVGSWVEIPAGGGPSPQTKSRAVWLMERHYSGGQADRSAAVKVALMERFWQLFRRKQGDLATTHDHLLPRGSWSWQELAAANDLLPPLEFKLPQEMDVEVADPANLAETEASPPDDAPLEVGAVHDDDSSSTTSSSASDESARGSDVDGVVPVDDVDSIQWLKQGSKVHLVRCLDDAGRHVPWCRDMAFTQDAKATGQGFSTSARQTFCQRCLARMPRGAYSALAAHCGWVH